jgi:DNA repair protein RadA/Sms
MKKMYTIITPILFGVFYEKPFTFMPKSTKTKTQYICQSCGNACLRWQGKCPSCGEWNTLVEEVVRPKSSRKNYSGTTLTEVYSLTHIKVDQSQRFLTISKEFNRVLGGGMVAGSVVLVGGDPGIGKSTLLLQEAAGLSKAGFKTLYVAGEESAQQIKLRAERIGMDSDAVFILPETDLDVALAKIESLSPNLVIVDSIQTAFTNKLESAPGTVSQVRECALQLIHVAKNKNIPIILVGHVTKEGMVAGPKVLEHMVDALLLFEGDRDHFYRILRAMKNRFGSTREIGVFEMSEKGLLDVANPSSVFLAERNRESTGSSIICCMEGTRPILVELQALATNSNFGLPQRTTTGFDLKRANMLLAVLEKRLGYRTGTMDVFLNAVGGFKVDETSADLGVIAAIASSVQNKVVDSGAILIGEVGLGGEVRSVSHIESRIKEAEKMGFKTAIIPKGNSRSLKNFEHIKVVPVSTALEAIDNVLQ